MVLLKNKDGPICIPTAVCITKYKNNFVRKTAWSGTQYSRGSTPGLHSPGSSSGLALYNTPTHLPSEAWRFEQLTDVISVTYRSWADCLLAVVVQVGKRWDREGNGKYGSFHSWINVGVQVKL